MKQEKQKINGWFRKKRISMSDPILREEEWAVHLSPMGLLGAVEHSCC